MKSEKRPMDGLTDRAGGFIALAIALWLFLAALDLSLSLLLTGAAESPFSPFLRNWLLLVFMLLAGTPGYSPSLLAVVNPVDLAVLFLTSATGFAVALSLAKARRTVSFVAALLPLAGIALIAATGTAGRSSIMLAVPILSLCLAKTASWKAAGTVIGVGAGVFLFLGDVFLGVFSSIFITLLFGAGYLALVAWFGLVAGKLLRALARQ
jgi:hypothetical protein